MSVSVSVSACVWERMRVNGGTGGAGDGGGAGDSGGAGILAMRSRLALLYPSQSALILQGKNAMTEVRECVRPISHALE